MVEPLTGVGSPRRVGRTRPLSLRRRALNAIGPLGWHAIYFSALCLIASGILYGVGRRIEGRLRQGEVADGMGEKVSYLDALFLGITSATGAGLGNVVLSRLDTLQQIVAFLLILVGSHLWVAACVVNIQRALLARRMLDRCRREIMKKKERLQQQQGAGKATGGKGMEKQDVPAALLEVPPLPPVSVSPDNDGCGGRGNSGAIPQPDSQCTTAIPSRDPSTVELPLPALGKAENNLISTAPLYDMFSSEEEEEEEEEEDGGIDDDDKEKMKEQLSALSILSWLLPAYLTTFQLLGTVCISAWMAKEGADIVGINAINPWWFGTFNAISAFNNSGMSLLDANMTPFARRGSFVVVVQCILIVAGNSGFPIFLKALLSLVGAIGDGFGCDFISGNAGLRLLRDGRRARKVFPYLFAPRETKWLIGMLVVLNGIDCIVFEVAASSPDVTSLPAARRVLAGLFQGLSVRSGGFAIVSIRNLHVAIQLTYTVMLYLSAFPLSLQSRSSSSSKFESSWAFMVRQLGGLMRAGDLRYLAGAVWLIAVLESSVAADVFPIVFEVASAFGCVGISFGAVKNDPRLALVGDWSGTSKLILAAIMLWGRFREVRRGILEGWGKEEAGPGQVLAFEKDVEVV